MENRCPVRPVSSGRIENPPPPSLLKSGASSPLKMGTKVAEDSSPERATGKSAGCNPVNTKTGNPVIKTTPQGLDLNNPGFQPGENGRNKTRPAVQGANDGNGHINIW